MSENQEPLVCSSNSSSDATTGAAGVSNSKLEQDDDVAAASSAAGTVEQSNEAEAKAVNNSTGEDAGKRRTTEPDLVSSSKESPGPAQQIRNNNEIRVRDNSQDEDNSDDDSNDGVVSGGGGIGGSNGDRELFNAPICSPYSLASSSSNSKSNPFGGSSTASQNILRGPILRPSAFKFACTPAQQTQAQQQQQQQQSSSGFVLRPPKLIPNSGSVGCKVQAQATSTTATLQFVPLEKDELEDAATKDEGLHKPEGPRSAAGASSSSTTGAFVFGSNLEERAVQGSPPSGKKRKIDGDEEQEGEVAGGVKKPSVVISGEEASSSDVKYTMNSTVTGEEEEVNVLQLHCRLFIFDSTNSTWVERGRGLLRLNDSKTPDEKNMIGSRLIIRTKGSLRVMLNTKVWEGIRVEKVGDKNIRIMAVDLEAVEKEEEQQQETAAALRIFLIMTTSISDAYTLVNALESRVRRLTN